MIIKRPSIKIRCTLVFELIHSIKWTIRCIYMLVAWAIFNQLFLRFILYSFFFTLYFSLFKWIAFQKQKVSSFVVHERYIGVELNKFCYNWKTIHFCSFCSQKDFRMYEKFHRWPITYWCNRSQQSHALTEHCNWNLIDWMSILKPTFDTNIFKIVHIFWTPRRL